MFDEAPISLTLYHHRAFRRSDFMGQIPNFKAPDNNPHEYCIRILGSGRKS
jgi:hypothetical protein